MNKKGFTLIELLGVIVLIGLVCIIAVPNLLDYLNTTKNESRKTLMKSIRTAAQTYYEECENGDLKEIINQTSQSGNENKYGNCDIDNRVLTIKLENLLNSGMIKIDEKDKNGNIIMNDPVSGENIGNCIITIKQEINTIKDNNITYNNYKYTITSTTGGYCPTTEELKS